MEKFLVSNKWEYRLLRTIVQGILGVLVSSLDVIVGTFEIPAEVKPIIVATCMAVLSPIMAKLGESKAELSGVDDTGE